MKHLFTLKSLLLVLFAVLGGVNVWGETLSKTWDLTSSSSDWEAYGNVQYFSQPYGFKKANGTLTNKSITDFSQSGITEIKVGFKCLQNGATTSKITIYLVDSNGNAIGDGVEVEPVNASQATKTEYRYATFTDNFESATGFMMKVTNFGKNILVNGADYVVTYTPPVDYVAPPVFSLPEGTCWPSQTLELTTTVEGGTIYYTTDGSDPTTNGIKYSAAITIPETTTIKACVKDGKGNYSDVVSRTYTFVPSIANTQETAYTTAEAIAIIDSHPAEQLAAEAVYVKGIISKIVTEYNSSYGNITFNISDGGTEEGDQFQFYRNIKAEGTNWDDADIKPCVGAEVIGYGKIKKYNSTYGFEAGNYLVSYVFDKTLESVAISGSATKTSYEEGETFDFSGLTLTATYDKGSTMDITSSATWTASPETLTLGTTEVTVTATYNEKTATATIPVNVTKAFPTVTLDLSTDKTTTATTEKIEWVRDEFTINSVKGGATAANNYYGGDTSKRTSTRFYKDNSFNVIPALFVNIRKITYTATTDTYAAALANSTWTNATASADNTTVTIVPEDGTKTITAKIGATTGATSIVVTYEVVDNADITLVAQDGTDYYATFSSKKAVEFVDAQVYTVDVTGTKLKLNEVTSKQVPANEGVLIKSSTNTVTVKTIEAASGISSKNLLHASSFPMKESGYMFYKLAYGDWENKADLGFYWGAANGAAFTAKAGGAYLAVPTGEPAGVKGFAFGADEETAIESVEAEAANEEIFDLSGRKVSKAVKGLYIINGKKVVK